MIVLLFTLSWPATCETFHIMPPANIPCPGELTGEPCFTLSQYLSGEYKQYISDPSEIFLKFQPGHHTAAYSSTIICFTACLFYIELDEFDRDLLW